MNRTTRTLSIATTAVACAGVVLVGAPAQAAPASVPTTGSADHIMDISRSFGRQGVDVRFGTDPLAADTTAGARFRFTIKTNGRVVYNSLLGPDTHENVRIFFPRHSGAHRVQLSGNGAKLMAYTIHTGHRL